MDQPTATIVAGVISAVVAALTTITIAKINAPSTKPTVYEFRFVHEDKHEPWIRGPSPLARIARAICWVLVFLLLMFGINTVMALGAIWFLAIETEHPDRIVVLAPLGLLAIIVAYWIGKRIEVKKTPRDDDDEDDDEDEE